MGIKHLWPILAPYCERKPLFELQGKTVAVDLSCWICEAQNIAEYQVQPRMYLRNLYFRTCYMLLMEIQPVFVLEGKAPELKYETIAARNAIQFKGAKPKTDKTKSGKDRSRFNHVLKQCAQMLEYLGIACIQGKGEAESLCAYLNEDGLVDGCISQDSDCFAYGAKVVYRNFSISQQGAHAASGGAVDVYDIDKVNKSLDFGRNKLVAMALILGSDYSDGVHGVGKDSIVKFFENISDHEVLDRLRSWRNNEATYREYERQLNDKNVCTSCGHYGKVQGHTKYGCNSCGTTEGCSSDHKEKRAIIKTELSIRSKSLLDPEFPDETLIKEFMERKDNVSSLNLKWKQPDLLKFVQFAVKFLTWDEVYAFEKILPILTRWQVSNPQIIRNNPKNILTPDRIKKARTPKGVPSYEIIWSDPNEYFRSVIPEDKLVTQDLEKLWSTIEPQGLVEQTYPDLVEVFVQSKAKPKKVAKRKKKTTVDNLGEMLQNTSITETKPKKPRKPRRMKKEAEKENLEMQALEGSFSEMAIEKPKQKSIDAFFKKAVVNNALKLSNNESTPLKSKVEAFNPELSFDPDMSRFGDEDDNDVSDIIDNIISKKPDYLKNLKLHDITPPKQETEPHKQEITTSSFFVQNLEEDVFEKTFNLITNEKSDELEVDEEETENTSSENKGVDVKSSDDTDDSFNIEYVPLFERIKRKQLI